MDQQNTPVQPINTEGTQPPSFQPQQIPTNQPIPVSTPINKSKGRSIIKTILVVILIILTLFTAYVVGMNILSNMEEPPIADDEEEKEPQELEKDITKWSTYENKEYGFLFKHPKLDSSCCSISGPTSSTARRIILLSDKSTVSLSGNDNRFDGIGVYVDQNIKELTFDAYINEEIRLQKEQYKILNGTEYISGGVVEIVKAGPGKEYEGKKVSGFTGDTNERYYYPFPDGQSILAFSLSADEKDSFKEIFELILTTVEFTDAQVKACNNSTLKIESKIPSDWTCEISLGDGTRNAVIKTNIKSSFYEIEMRSVNSNNKENPPCISTGKDAQPGCFFSDFYIRPDFTLQLYRLNNKNIDIYGFLKNLDLSNKIYISIKYTDMAEKSLSEEEKMPLLLFLDSIKL